MSIIMDLPHVASVFMKLYDIEDRETFIKVMVIDTLIQTYDDWEDYFDGDILSLLSANGIYMHASVDDYTYEYLSEITSAMYQELENLDVCSRYSLYELIEHCIADGAIVLSGDYVIVSI